MTGVDSHQQNIRDQFSQRIKTYESSARWMLSPELIDAHRRVAGTPSADADRAIDLCCGTGIVGRNLLDLGWNVDGLDLTPQMATVANSYFPTTVGSVEAMPLGNSIFDLALLRQSFMLVDGPRTLHEIHRILKPDGRFVLLQSVAFSEADDTAYAAVQNARHINIKKYYRAEDLTKEISRFGFEIIGQEFLRVRESVDHWLLQAPELTADLRNQIRELILNAPESYKTIRQVRLEGEELFEDWNWSVVTARKI